jgi:hypothetical protein
MPNSNAIRTSPSRLARLTPPVPDDDPESGSGATLKRALTPVKAGKQGEYLSPIRRDSSGQQYCGVGGTTRRTSPAALSRSIIARLFR